MLLSARMLKNVASVNLFAYTDVVKFTEGDNPVVYFQLVDLDQDRSLDGYNPPGKRFCPAATSTLQVSIVSIDNAKRIVRYASQPFAQDPSIWALTLMPSDVLKGSADLLLVLTQPTNLVTRGAVRQALAVEPQSAARS